MRAYRNRQSTIFEQLEDGERRVFEKALKGSISALDTSGKHLPMHNYVEPDDFLFPLTDHTSGGVDTEEGDAVELPFRPVLDKLRFYFRLKFGKRMFLQEGRATTSEARYDIAAERLGLCEPYSGEWLECLALTYLRKLDSLAEANASTDEIIATAVGLGRLVEHYRWRLLHGENAVRGKKVRDNPKKGAEARARNVEATTKAILAEMQRLVPDQSITNAARIAASKGFGTSTDANRRLWSRYQGKK